MEIWFTAKINNSIRGEERGMDRDFLRNDKVSNSWVIFIVILCSGLLKMRRISERKLSMDMNARVVHITQPQGYGMMVLLIQGTQGKFLAFLLQHVQILHLS